MKWQPEGPNVQVPQAIGELKSQSEETSRIYDVSLNRISPRVRYHGHPRMNHVIGE